MEWLNKHDPVYRTEGSLDVVGVRVSNITTRVERAWLYREDYDRVVAKHGRNVWLLHGYEGKSGRIETVTGGKPVSVANLIVSHKSVKLRNGNPFDLRRENIVIPTDTREKRAEARAQTKAYWAARYAREVATAQ